MKVTWIKTGLKFIAALSWKEEKMKKNLRGESWRPSPPSSKGLLKEPFLHLSVLKDSAYSFPHKYALF